MSRVPCSVLVTLTSLSSQTDLVSTEDLDDIMAQVQQINAVAQLRCTQRSTVDLSWILDTKCFSPELALAVDPGLAATAKASRSVEKNDETVLGDLPSEEGETGCGETGCGEGGGDSHSQEHQHHQHNDGHGPHGEACADCVAAATGGSCSVHDAAVTTHSVELPGSLELARLERWLGGLLWDPLPGGTEVYRVKGVVSVQGRIERFVVQGVADLFEVAPAGVAGSTWQEGEARRCKMVFIGRHLSKEELERGVKSCMV